MDTKKYNRENVYNLLLSGLSTREVSEMFNRTTTDICRIIGPNVLRIIKRKINEKDNEIRKENILSIKIEIKMLESEIRILKKTIKRERRIILGLDERRASGYGSYIGLVSGGLQVVREKVRKRDNYTCIDCNKKWDKRLRRLDVHHLDEINGRSAGALKSIKYDKENMHRLITLCHNCHTKRHKIIKINKKNMEPKI